MAQSTPLMSARLRALLELWHEFTILHTWILLTAFLRSHSSMEKREFLSTEAILLSSLLINLASSRLASCSSMESSQLKLNCRDLQRKYWRTLLTIKVLNSSSQLSDMMPIQWQWWALCLLLWVHSTQKQIQLMLEQISIKQDKKEISISIEYSDALQQLQPLAIDIALENQLTHQRKV